MQESALSRAFGDLDVHDKYRVRIYLPFVSIVVDKKHLLSRYVAQPPNFLGIRVYRIQDLAQYQSNSVITTNDIWVIATPKLQVPNPKP